MTNYKCLICEKLGENPHTFKKSNGAYYIETHHVEPVSRQKKGILYITNLITVCANHHRQLHYENSQVIENRKTHFTFIIDDKTIKIDKIRI